MTMNTGLPFYIRRVLRWGSLVALLLLAACHLPFSMPPRRNLFDDWEEPC
jgi:hypothetical protein